MANNFAKDGGGVKGYTRYWVKNANGEERFSAEKHNAAFQIKELARIIPLGPGILGIGTDEASLFYVPTTGQGAFNTKQTDNAAAGGVGGTPGIAMYSKNVGFQYESGTKLTVGYAKINNYQAALANNAEYNVVATATGSFLNDGTCRNFDWGAMWHGTAYTDNSHDRGFNLQYFFNNLGVGSFEYSSGDTITVDWRLTIS